MKQYQNLALFYDTFNDDAYYEEYCDFIMKNTSCFNHRASFLDLGCGTGNMSLLLAKRGFDVIGLDNSEEMLAVAYNKTLQSSCKVFYTQQDMSDFSLHSKVDCVISCFDCLNYILDKTSLLNVFLNVKKALKDDGVFIFDVNTLYRFEKVYANNVSVFEKKNLFFVWENNYSKKNKKCKFTLNFFEKRNEGYFRFTEYQTQKFWDNDTIIKLLTSAGFKNVSVFYDKDVCKSAFEDSNKCYYVVR